MAFNSGASKSVETGETREASSDWSAAATRYRDSLTRLINLVATLQQREAVRSPEITANSTKSTPEVPISVENVSSMIANDYSINRKDGDKWQCEICEKELSGMRELADHVGGIEHGASMKKYGCENITMIRWCVYRCECCDCEIPGKRNVCVHFRGKRHAACRSAMRNAGEPEETAKSSPKTVKSSNNFAKLLRGYRAKAVERMARRRCAAGRAAIQKIACDFCSFTVDNSADLHSHLAGHLSADFVGAKLDENDNLPCSSGRSKELFERSSDESSHPSRPVDHAEHANPIRDLVAPPISDEKSPTRFAARCPGSDEDRMYELRRKKVAMRLSARLCLLRQDGSVYCLVCRRTAAAEISRCGEHFSSLDHIADLAGMRRDDALFEHAPGQLSELRLALDFMLETSDGTVRCLLCDRDVEDNDEALRGHILLRAHAARRRARRSETAPILRDASDRTRCDWYDVQNYWCVACSVDFDSEIAFAEHLGGVEHSERLLRTNLSRRALMFDFCASCALLWYGHPTTCVYHRRLTSHKWLLRDGYYSMRDLPPAAQSLLRDVETYRDELSVEKSNERILGSIYETFPVCRKIMRFAREWLVLCDLTGRGGISDCAIFWYVVFYLQREYALPSIATLMGTKSEARLVDAQVMTSDPNIRASPSSSHNEDARSTSSFKEYLLRFFRFYSDFDYRHDVACPLLGKIVEKRLFVEPKKLPREMSAYVDCTEKCLDPRPLRMDFPMCVQDPFDLSQNLTKNVGKVNLGRFRRYCAESRDLLCSF